MDWQGIPFKVLEHNLNSLSLAVNSLPDLVIKSAPDYTPAIITGIVSLVAGIIPAGIAIFTFYKNSKVIKKERIEQQAFLKAEREDQQRFLKEERAAHAASMEADRNTQKEIAERNFNMQVLSVNRQAWINKVRELLTEYMALAPDLLFVQFEFINCKEHFGKCSARKKHFDKSAIVNEAVNASFSDASERLAKAIKNLSDSRVKEKLLTGHIKLMLNPSEKWYPVLENVFLDVSVIYNSFDILEQDEYLKKIGEMNRQVDICLSCSQDLLKYEWNRVKKGE